MSEIWGVKFAGVTGDQFHTDWFSLQLIRPLTPLTVRQENVFASNCINVFVSNCQMNLLQISKCFCLKFLNVFVTGDQFHTDWFSLQLKSPLTPLTLVKKRYLPPIAKIYLSLIDKCICLKLQNVFVSNF